MLLRMGIGMAMNAGKGVSYMNIDIFVVQVFIYVICLFTKED